MKGVFLRTNILCDTIPPPPPGANAKPPELEPGHDHARERRGDHRDAGDGLRRLPRHCDQPARLRDRGVRRARPLPHARSACSTRAGAETGTQAGEHDRRSRRSSYGDQTAVSTPAELMSLMLGQRQGRGLPGAQLLPLHATRRWEDPTTDGCALEDARKALANGGTHCRSRRRRGEDGAVQAADVPVGERMKRQRQSHRHLAAADAARASAARRWRCRSCRRCWARRPTPPTRCSRARRACAG